MLELQRIFVKDREMLFVMNPGLESQHSPAQQVLADDEWLKSAFGMSAGVIAALWDEVSGINANPCNRELETFMCVLLYVKDPRNGITTSRMFSMFSEERISRDLFWTYVSRISDMSLERRDTIANVLGSYTSQTSDVDILRSQQLDNNNDNGSCDSVVGDSGYKN